MNDVQELISRMTSAEKRYFKLSNAGKNSQSMLLFDFYSKSKQDVSLKSVPLKLENINYLNHILSDQILVALGAFKKKKSPFIKLNQLLVNCRVLFDMGLFLQAKKQVKKGRKLAGELDDALMELQFIFLEKKITKELFNVKEFKEKIQDNLYFEEELLEKYKQQIVFGHKELLMTFIGRTMGFQQSDLVKNELNDFRLFLDHNKYESCLSFRSKKMFLYIQALYFLYKNDFQKALECQLEILKVFEVSPHLVEEELVEYIGSIYNACVTYLYLEEFPRVKIMFNKLNKYRGQSNSRIVNLKLFSYLGMEIALSNNIGESEKVDEYDRLIQDGMKNFSNEIHITAKLFMYFQLGLAYYVEGKYTLAKNRLNMVIYDKFTSSFPRMEFQAIVIQLFIHFEKNEFDQLKEKVHYIMEEEINSIVKYPELYLILNYFKTTKDLAVIKTLETFKQKLLKQKKKLSKQNIVTDLNLVVWIDSIINKTSYKSELIRFRMVK